MHKAIVEYQDPTKADAICKITKDLDETKEVLHKTIESVLERGEKLDSLVSQSEDLTKQSKMFYKEAKKTNACCKMM
jgi:synaptobrevin family protein YKT6